MKEDDVNFAFENLQSSKNDFHTILYKDSNDPVLCLLAQANSMEDVFKIMSSQQDFQLNEKHASQAIATLWDMQRFYCSWTGDGHAHMDYVKSLREFISVCITSYSCH